MAQEIEQIKPLAQFTLLDEKLLVAAEAGWTPQRMHTVYGIPAAEAALRVKKMLESTDIWTAVEKKKMLISSVMRIKEEFDKKLKTVAMDKDLLRSYMTMVKFVADRLDKETQFTDEELSKVSDAQRRSIITAVETGYYRVRQHLKDYYPDVDLIEIDTEFRVGLQEGFLADE